MKFENTEVFNFDGAFRGMRNPLESWSKADSGCKLYCSEDDTYVEKPCGYDACNGCRTTEYIIGDNDLKLAQTLIKAGSEHRKFMRQIFVSVDITAPLFFFKEFSTYKVGTVSNSCSTMHKLAATPITLDCFEMDDFQELPVDEKNNNIWFWNRVIEKLEFLRKMYLSTKNKAYWKELIRLLPESWLQKRTVTMSYENVLKMIRERRGHKLTEWSKSFIEWAESLPYAKELLFYDVTG